MTINNFDLVKLCKYYNITLKIENIIMSSNLKNIKLRKAINVIINLEKPNHNGSHWVALIIRNNLAFYFDSFGCPPDSYVLDYCKKYKLSLAINNFIIQDLDSTECGIFCVGLLKYIKNEINNTLNKQYRMFDNTFYETCNNYCNMFEDDTQKNDNRLHYYMNN